MAVIVIYDPAHPDVANAVTQFLPSAHAPNYTAETNKATNPDLSLLWTGPQPGTYLVPQKYWKWGGGNTIVEMNTTEKNAVDQLDPETLKLNQGVDADSGPTGPLDAAIEVERGSAANASLKWDQGLGTWVIGTFGQEVEVADVDQLTTVVTSSSIKDLSDVRDPMTPTDGQVLTWNNGNSEWEAMASSAHEIDVSDGGVPVTGTPFSSLNFIGAGVTLADGGGGEVDITIAGGGAAQLSDLSDVNTSTPTNRNVLVADGVDFESRALVEADISDLQSYLTAEVNDLTAAVTWANVPNANITQGSVTQHVGAIDHDSLLNFAASEHFTQAAISIPLSQISDVTALAAEVNLLDLSGLTVGWVLSADSATTASWKAPTGGGAGSTLASVQARRTTAYTLTTSYVDITFDATDEETDAANLEHNNTNTDRIDIKADGTYLISYNFSLDAASPASTTQAFGRVRSNDTTVLNGSDARTTVFGDTSLDGTGGEQVDDHLSHTFIATLSTNDFISLQLQHTGNAATTYANGTLAVVKLDGVAGADGATGATGSGSNVTVEDDDVSVTGTPHSTLNFGTGLSATNDGGGQVTIAAENLSPILQVVHKNVTTNLSTSASIDPANTPTSTDGTAFDSQAITMNGANTVRFQMVIPCAGNNDSGEVVALVHRGTTVLAVTSQSTAKKEFGQKLVFDFYDTPGTGTHTYSVRVGDGHGHTAHFNETVTDSTPFGGTLFRNNCNITLTEMT